MHYRRSILTLLFCLATVVSPSLAASSPGSEVDAPRISRLNDATVERVSFSRRQDGAGHVIRIHASDVVAGVSVPKRDASGTFSIELFRTTIDENRVLDNPILPIESYHIEQVDQNVVLRLSLVGSEFNVEAYRDRASNDILVAVSPHNVPPAVSPVDPNPEAAKRWTLDTIVIDAGHGGQDHGAVGIGGLKEKDVVLSVALKVGDYLKELLGVDVLYTRSTDQFISLQGRGHFANQAGAKLFVSIHANSAPDRRASGTETYFLGLHKSDAAKRVMDRENEVIRFEDDPTTYEQISTRVAVMQSLAQSAYMRQSQYLADLVEDQFESRVGRKSRGVKQAGFYVLYGASMPSILVELGFISNMNEAAFMGSSEGQVYLASAIYRAISEYKTEYEKGLQLSSSSGK